MLTPEEIARACAHAAHEANRAYCIATGDRTQPPWDQAPRWQLESAIAGALAVMNGTVRSPRDSHEAWMKQKFADGWVYGPQKNVDEKTHPCLLPFEALPRNQRLKDFLFIDVVRATAAALSNEWGESERESVK